ncbi:ribonucleoside-diphosphate reductase, adenosylcobalamin-dependent [Candidatus Woesearchaeota archaeon CG_4_10_14_0_2_um_filter_33_13]|nr:MAG: ribonucleoside-diphosphate reductase, adenosylcobalamin-dependent [Candidatus Woesearchaeota archaeon CG_4_10_14_0_2_um_filter_33_13]
MLEQVRKRDGNVVEFDESRIMNAIFKASQSIGQEDLGLAKELTQKVMEYLEIMEVDIPEIELIQDIVEKVLIEEGHVALAKEFIIYRYRRGLVRNESSVTNCKTVENLLERDIYLSAQAIHVLNNSSSLTPLGQLIFLDRYSLKSSQKGTRVGDLVIIIYKEDPKYPKKELGIVLSIDGDYGKFYLINQDKEFSQSIWKVDRPEESVLDTYKRVAKAAAAMEQDQEKRKECEKLFLEELKSKRIQPGGRIMAGANVDSQGNYLSSLTLYNCYVVPSPQDSRGGIIDTLKNMIEIMSRGGGVGISLSTLRPRYSYVKGVHGKSSGAVSWGGIYSYATGLIEQGGSRRGALMLMLDDWHPDILEFIASKKKKGMIENANISIKVSDHFMEKMKTDGMWNLEFPDHENEKFRQIYRDEWDGDLLKWKSKGYPTKVYKSVKAKELWDLVISSAHVSAEPGIVFMERYNKMSNSWYFNPIVCTNPCAEQGLPPWGVCNLGHLYLASFAKQKSTDTLGNTYEMDWDQLRQTARVLTRFLDNIIDLTPYHFKENEENQKSERRIGGGTLGLAELLIKLRIRYGSEESLKFIDKLYRTITEEMYKESVELAKEKGPFPKFDRDKFIESLFVKQLSKEIQDGIYKHGIRNVTLVTQAPTGTVGSMLNTSTGIEPYYAFEYYQQSRLGFHKVLIPLAEDAKLDDGSLPTYFVSAMQLLPEDHVKAQAAVQKWTDSSISKTVNAPSDFTVEQTKKVYELAYDLGCKGLTVYIDNSRHEQILSTSADTEHKNVQSATGEKEILPRQKIDPSKIVDSKKKEEQVVYGSTVGNRCPGCKEGTMVKIGGCTECSNQCGFKGACGM